MKAKSVSILVQIHRGFPSSHPQQANLLLSWERADGCEARAIQSSLLDLEQLMAGVKKCRTSFEHSNSVPFLFPQFLICSTTSSLFVSPNLPQTHKHSHCWCYLENGSSVDCCVHQSVMNINEEPPHQRTYIIHQRVDLFVLTPVEIFFLSIYMPTLPAVDLFFYFCCFLFFLGGASWNIKGRMKGRCQQYLSVVITSTRW